MNYVELAKEALPQHQRNIPPQHVTTEPLESVLKGRVIELWSDALGEGFWLVADEEDAARLREPRGTIYTAAEARRVVQISDAAAVAEIHKWKRAHNATVRDASRM